MPPKKKRANDDEAESSKSKQNKKAEEPEEEEDEEAEIDITKPYEGFVFVITGNFPMSSDMIERRIIALGGKVASAVAKSTTHLMLGDSGTTMYGQKTGQGSKKYKEAKKRKCITFSINDLNDAETAANPGGGSGNGGSGGTTSKLQNEWNEFLLAVQLGNDKGLWKEQTFNPPATIDEIASIEKEFGYRLGKYTDLLLLTNGCSFAESINDGSEWISLQFGGTLDNEEGLSHAFNYSDDYGRKHFRKTKRIPMFMMDYDMCVNIMEPSGEICQDDRECGSFHHLFSSPGAMIKDATQKIMNAISKVDEKGEKK